jgi:hypothetical protein
MSEAVMEAVADAYGEVPLVNMIEGRKKYLSNTEIRFVKQSDFFYKLFFDRNLLPLRCKGGCMLQFFLYSLNDKKEKKDFLNLTQHKNASLFL